MASNRSAPSIPLLDDIDTQNLLYDGLLFFAPVDRHIRLHKSCIPQFAQDDTELPVSTHVNRRPLPNVSEGDYVKLPEYMISEETLRYIGFTAERAASIWSTWIRWTRLQNNYGGRGICERQAAFLAIATSAIHNHPETFDTSDAMWRTIMTAMGVTGWIQDEILDPDVKDFRFMDSCKEVVLDTVNTRFAVLETIQDASRSRDWPIRWFAAIQLR